MECQHFEIPNENWSETLGGKFYSMAEAAHYLGIASFSDFGKIILFSPVFLFVMRTVSNVMGRFQKFQFFFFLFSGKKRWIRKLEKSVLNRFERIRFVCEQWLYPRRVAR
jgi:hypothetical protein